MYCHSFLQSRGVLEINLQIILAVYKFNTLPLYKKECLFTIFLSYPTATDILLNNFKSIYLFVTLEYWVISSQYYDYYVDTLTNITITDSFGRGSQKKSTAFRILAIYFLRQLIVWSQISYPNHITSFFIIGMWNWITLFGKFISFVCSRCYEGYLPSIMLIRRILSFLDPSQAKPKICIFRPKWFSQIHVKRIHVYINVICEHLFEKLFLSNIVGRGGERRNAGRGTWL